MKEIDIIKEILDKVTLQISDLEREDTIENVKKDIAKIICEKTLSTTNYKRFPLSVPLNR